MNNSYIADPHQKKLLKKWSPILESGKKITSETTKIALAQILENTRNFYKAHNMLNEAGIPTTHTGTIGSKAPGATVLTGKTGMGATGMGPGPDGYGDFYLPNVVIPMLRRIMPDLIANDLVGVQPLHGPVGYALAYRPIYADTNKEIGYHPTDTTFTGELDNEITASMADEKTSDYWDAYAGTADYRNAWAGRGRKVGDAEFQQLYGDSNVYGQVSFGLVKSPVEAKTRKLAAHWSPELAEDMQAMHGIDVEREMVNTLTYEVGAEIDRQIITEMVKAAITGGSVSEWNPVSADGLDQMGRLATLLTQITVEAQQIAIRTRRGNANFVVTTPRVCALLQQMSMNKFTSFKNTEAVPTVPDTGVGALAKIGLINDDQQLLVRDSYASAGTKDYVLLGYKGKQAGDSGVIYCPYIPLQLSKIIQPNTFTPSIGARTRYGVMSNPWDAKNFYHFMKVTGTYSEYNWMGQRQFLAPTSPVVLPDGKGFDYSRTVFPQSNQPADRA